jgi:hypothetical protein
VLQHGDEHRSTMRMRLVVAHWLVPRVLRAHVSGVLQSGSVCITRLQLPLNFGAGTNVTAVMCLRAEVSQPGMRI